MRVSMTLADSAKAVDGKLYVLGGGWTLCGPGLTTCAVAVQFKLDWHETNVRHDVRLELLSDGEQVLLPTPDGEKPLVVTAWFQSAPMPETRPGSPLSAVLAFEFYGVPIPPGGVYDFRVWVDDETSDEWYVAFATREEQSEARAA